MGAHHYKLEVVPRRSWLDENPLDSLRILIPNDKSWGVEEYTSANNLGSDIRIWKKNE